MLPILIVFLIRAFYELYPSITISGYLKYFVKNFSFGFASTEYWFVFALFGYILVAPFLAHAFAKMTRFEQKAFLFIGLAFNLLTVIAENAGYAFKWRLCITSSFRGKNEASQTDIVYCEAFFQHLSHSHDDPDASRAFFASNRRDSISPYLYCCNAIRLHDLYHCCRSIR